MRVWLRLLCALTVLVSGVASAGALPVSTSPAFKSVNYVSSPQHPTEVQIGLYLIHINFISPPSDAFPRFEAEMFLDLKWHDPRLAFEPEQKGVKEHVYEAHDAELMLDQIWWPDPVIKNQEHERKTESLELIVSHDGTVEYKERFNVMVAAEFDLTRFPYDVQTLKLDVESFAWDVRELQFVPYKERSGYEAAMRLNEWNIEKLDLEIKDSKEVRSPIMFSEFLYKLQIKRNPSFYLWKVALPLIIIVAISWTAFWMKGEPVTGRLQRSFILLLTVVAYHRVVVSYLPTLPHLTLFDAFVMTSYLFSVLTIIESIIVHRLKVMQNEWLADRVDHYACTVVPILYLVCVASVVFSYLG